jgi:TolB protein
MSAPMSTRLRFTGQPRMAGPVLLLVALFLAGCTAGDAATVAQRLLARQPAAQGVPPTSPDNQLLIQGTDGNLYIGTPDGTARFALTSDASLSRAYAQPTWSADGSRIAWSRLDRRGSALMTSSFDGSQQSEVRVPFLPFYINWSPTGNRLAYLSNWQVVDEPSIALRIVAVEEEANRVTTVASGQPFYFAWSPDGEQMITHIGNERVELQAVDGTPTSLVISGGAFPTPQWAPDGQRLLYAVADDTVQSLVITDLEGTPLQELTTYEGRITFLQSPDGQRVAYVLTDAETDANTLGPLYVVNADTLRTTEITDRPVVAFFWSPDATKLAYLTLERVNARLGMRWNVWDGDRRTAYAAFLPTNTFLRDYLPFFDQYAQSHRIWAPDSSAFVFAGTLANGEAGIWVQRLGGDEAPEKAGTGLFASWSPQ